MDEHHNSYASYPVDCLFLTSAEAGHQDFHFHESYEIYLLLDGEIDYYVEQSCCHMKPGDLILFTSQEIHKAVNRTGEPYSRMVIHVDPLYIWQFCTPQTDLLRCFHQHRPGVNNMISLTAGQFQLFSECFDALKRSREESGYGDDVRGVASLLRLLLMINESFLFLPDQKPEFYDHRLKPVMEYIGQRLPGAITLEDMAAACSLDKYYLSHLFKRETGSTVSQYILVKRIVIARELLSIGSSVAEACEQSGFGDYANFIRTFKKVTGYSPGYFKKLNRDL